MNNETKYRNSRKRAVPGECIKKGVVVGRDKKVIDPDEVRRLAEVFVTYQEMSDFFDVPIQTLQYNFGKLIDEAKARTKSAIRRRQIAAAMDGNISMLIWLGKNLLKQQDKVNLEHTMSNDYEQTDDATLLEMLNEQHED